MSFNTPLRRARLSLLLACLPVAAHADFVTDFAVFELAPGQEQVLELPRAISAVRVVKAGVATAQTAGTRLTLRAAAEGRTQVELLLAGEETVRTLGLTVRGQAVAAVMRPAAEPVRAEPPAATLAEPESPPAPEPLPEAAPPAQPPPAAAQTVAPALAPRVVPPLLIEPPPLAEPVSIAEPAEPGADAESTALPLGTSPSVAALSLPAGSLLNAVSKGLALHPEVRVAQAELQRAEAEREIARSGYLPTVEMSAGPESGAEGRVGYNVTVSQPVYDWGKVAGSVDTASAIVRQKADELAVVRERLAMEIIDTFLDLSAAQQRLLAVEAHRQRVDGLHALTETRARDGYADASERTRAALTLARASEQIEIERGRVLEAEAQYQILVGERPGTLAPPPEDPGLNDPAWFARLADAIPQSPAFRKTENEVEAAEARIRNARAELLPELRLEGSSMRREIGGELTNDSMVALRLRMNPFQGSSNLRRVDAERQRLEAAQWTRDNLEREIRRKLSTLAERVATLGARAQALAAQRRQALDLRGLYEDQFQAALREVNDLLIVETELLDSERQRIDANTERLRAQYRAASEVGLLTAALDRDEDRLSEVTVP
ncbi:TolC family protein [Thauera humireducens]|uniref:TolC family protein n=1 Tax=Thauera humireducens TaxID=1134435 RepID=UPI0024A84675|nr:TolC family protein [Thauera humireducens]